MFRSKQRGDTIVEVMLALTVIGMALGIAYGIANRSLATGRLAQERIEALKLAEGQLEHLKSFDVGQVQSVRDINTSGGSVCIRGGVIYSGGDYAGNCVGVQTFYTIELRFTPEDLATSTPELFESFVTWDPPQGSIDAEVSLRYRP